MATVTSAGSGHLRSSHDSGLNGSAGLGELLRHARESRGLTLERVARETRIPQRHLEALEHGDLGASPAGFYQRAEVRAYARAVGLDQELALAQLQSALKPVEAPRAEREASKPKGPTSLRTYVLIALAVIVASMAAAALSRAISEPSASPALQTDSSAPAAPVQPAASVPSDATGPSQSPSTPPAIADSQPATETPEAPASPPAVTELVVTTQPAGARITVNGIGWGVSPVTIRHMPAGEKRIRVSKEGYASEERVLRVDAGRRQELEVQLNAAQ